MSKHNDFILTPITMILEEGVSASSGIGSGIETYPLSDYIMQSMFLKMTGFQEQKLKCIVWEMATNDFDYRRKFLNNEDNLGEYSRYNAKNSVFKRLYEQLKQLDNSVDLEKIIKKTELIDETKNLIKRIFKNTNLAIWAYKNYDYFCSQSIIDEEEFLKKNKQNEKFNLFEGQLKNKYEVLYTQRNRIAHNTTSYQQNLPTFAKLNEEDDESRNYFVWFYILLLMDSVFIKMYKEYKRLLDESIR